MISIAAYPEGTLEGMIARKLVQMIVECEDHAINLEPISDVISGCRALMLAANWPAVYQHNFFNRLRLDLTALTSGHPVTRQFVTMLEIELESN